ncbi:MAG TPA: methyltransferase domain-containing protein [Acidimicrobiales bacterium]|nr:methyltransferase domain-containing protein [Acidimicrobiales bacterium]
MTISDVAAQGFGADAWGYERGRPTYPAVAVSCLVAELGLGPSSVVVDLAAGTGKMSRLLAPSAGHVVAVEPVAAMRSVLVELVPDAGVVAATAEHLPLAGASVDAVVAAQAFHWFAVDQALAEVARVVRPGGGLALVWNDRDTSVPWVAELSALIEWDDRPVASYHERDWLEAMAATGHFEQAGSRRFRLRQSLDADTLVDRVLSTSYIAARPLGEQQALAREVRRLVENLGQRFELPYLTDVYWCRRG